VGLAEDDCGELTDCTVGRGRSERGSRPPRVCKDLSGDLSKHCNIIPVTVSRWLKIRIRPAVNGASSVG
jgi:hypothetical protein